MVWNLIKYKYKYKYAVFVFVFVFANTNTYLTPALFWTLEWHSGLSTTLPFRFPVHRLHWSRHSLSPPCPSSILQISVGPGIRIPSAFYTPPALNYPPPPPTPLYLTHKTPPTLTHWWFSTWGAQPRHPTDGSPPLTHQPINLHLPTP